MGSPRKGKATDTLVDKAIDGAVSLAPDCRVKKLSLVDCDIKFCRNCLACRDSKEPGPFAPCSIRDDMDHIREDIVESDSLIFGTPVHMGSVTAIMLTFLERICWSFAKPEGKIFPLTRCPIPRSEKKRKSVTIVVSGIVPPFLRRTCDTASSLIRQTVKDSLNARTVGELYAGDVEHRGAERYFDKAFSLGKKLA
jgi:multimeric flavodoxin WrbA